MTSAHEIYRAERLPIFQNRMFRTEADAVNCATGDVVLVQDSRSGLIFNRAFDASLMNYDADYQNEQANSAVFTAHLDEIARLIQQHFDGFSLIEVGCGKGHFLEKLQARGFQITGVDPTYDGSNPSVIRDYFSPQMGRNHTHDHVLAELHAYAPLTSIGSYCVVFDTIVDDLPADAYPDRPWAPGNNPKTAVRAYLREHPEFEIDRRVEHKLLIIVAPEFEASCSLDS